MHHPLRISRTFKRVVAVVTGIVLLLSAFPVISASADNVSTQAQLLAAIQNNKDITLTADIQISDTTLWTTPTNAYTKTFDGQGHVISNLNAPLMTSLTGTVKNVGVMSKESMSGEAILTKTSSGTVEGVFVYGTISYGDTAPLGGLIGEMTGGSVTKSFSCVEITTSTGDYVGGLIGKLTGGTVTSCYSAGTITSTVFLSHTAGLAYAVDADKNGTPEATVSDTYSSVQLRSETPYAKPSGVNGLYDNQLSIVRESAENEGVSTRALMGANSLSENFAVTSAAYPALTNFYHTMWGATAQNVVCVSTAAAAFTDVDSSKRMEPSAKFVARADYLLADTLVDKTNTASLSWNISSTSCRVYDTVPFIADREGAFTTGNSADLLRSELVFSADVSDVPLTATCGNAKRTWYLTVKRSANPYFNGGDGKASGTAFQINSKTQLQYVRYYTRVDTAYYKQTANISVGSSWPPITDFRGDYDGGNKLLYSMTSVKDNGETGFGFIGNTYATATLKNIRLRNMYFTGGRNVPTGLLVGKANAALTLENISLSGNNCYVKGHASAYVGGLIGHAAGKLTMTNCLLSVQITRGATTGGLVGYISGASSTVQESGVTGYVTGSKYIGGLIGRTSATTTVQNCFSTAAVVSDAAANSNYAGGLIGNAASATIKTSYCAALTDAPSFTGKGVIVGVNGTVNNTVYYDKVYLVDTPNGQNANATGLSTTELIAKNPDSTKWTLDGKHYPQVTYHTTATYFKYISPVATIPVRFQQYWEDTATGDITTGFIADTALHATLYADLDEPTPIATFNSAPAETIYAFTNGTDSGYGFEAGSGQRRMMLLVKSRGEKADVTDASNNSGIRVIAIVRDDLVPLKYTVTGASGARAYVELYYSNDNKATWQGSGVMTPSGGTAKVLYDMPKGSYVKVKVTTADDYAVSSVKIGSTTATLADGFYISSGTFSSETTVTVTLKTNTPPWGLRRQTH